MVELATVPNETRCQFTEEEHWLEISDCCPVSRNPLPGSVIKIKYEPNKRILEVASLRSYVDSYQGGRGEVRSMEGMVQAIAQDAANILDVDVEIVAALEINPGQKMHLRCFAFPDGSD